MLEAIFFNLIIIKHIRIQNQTQPTQNIAVYFVTDLQKQQENSFSNKDVLINLTSQENLRTPIKPYVFQTPSTKDSDKSQFFNDTLQNRKKCKCSNSKCVKLYCDCFSTNQYCGKLCGCVGCENNIENENQLKIIRKNIKQKNPLAFEEKFFSQYKQQKDISFNQDNVFDKIEILSSKKELNNDQYQNQDIQNIQQTDIKTAQTNQKYEENQTKSTINKNYQQFQKIKDKNIYKQLEQKQRINDQLGLNDSNESFDKFLLQSQLQKQQQQKQQQQVEQQQQQLEQQYQQYENEEQNLNESMEEQMKRGLDIIEGSQGFFNFGDSNNK
ncbi:hypothetical protein PPERSA_04461 [Pseudocohnilembus persalinus]|uniref:CRC domain-containing protein n=1 Tax=Pseudocohnilembus persalinus TaxID=266149 RepID=A0A0V0QQX1_PSEPJ|nr:hypothetical protein PPERSA_04461 [Pseudocohnilembus persalinus]|eukprot:KRX04646.1 hypothetical protein PPERSA_04461 [Pseudocohnilembus persalinus]